MKNNGINIEKLREIIARCQWKFAKTMPFAPHEYIVRDKCPLTDDEFVYFIDMQRRFGVKERWGKYNNPYLYIDDYKYWTMGDPYDKTTVINRAKACVVDDAHKLYEGMKEVEGNECVDKYIHEKLGLKPRNKGYNINLLSGRLDELEACVSHLRRSGANGYQKTSLTTRRSRIWDLQIPFLLASFCHTRTFLRLLLFALRLLVRVCTMV